MPSKAIPSALTVEQLAAILRAAGGSAATLEEIRLQLADGAPTNPDGTINFVHFIAYLAKRHNANN